MLTKAQVKKILKQDSFHEVPVNNKKKITLEELRKNSHFDKFVGIFDGPEFAGKTSREIVKMWTNYVD